jgi:TatD DNase family protein
MDVSSTPDHPAMLVDSHAHLTMFEPGEREQVLERAVGAGVAAVLVPATGDADLEDAVALAAGFPERVVAAVGVHPHEASTLDAALKRRLERAVRARGVVAVGEIGLDYHYLNSPREDQLEALRWQLALAVEAGLPVVLHNRESWHDLEPILSDAAGSLRGVCHSFTEGAGAARRVVELGLMVGISGMVTFRRSANIREQVEAIGLGDLLVETDSPYLAPVPHRGTRNEPAHVRLVAETVAETLGCGVDEVARRTTAAFRGLFDRDPGQGRCPDIPRPASG